MPGWNPFEFLFRSPRYVTLDSSDVPTIGRDQTEAHLLRLDPIEVAGRFDASGVPQSTIIWFEIARSILTNPRPPIVIAKSRARRTHVEYKAHLETLAGYKVVSLQNATFKPNYICAYFAVPKKDETARSIFSGGILTPLTSRMPSVNIPDALYIAELIAHMAQKFDNAICISVMDLRHWFHQIRIPPEWRQYFTICVDKLLYTWNVLPMGWTASPFLAQAMALGVIAVMLKKDHGIEFEGENQESLPHHLISKCGNVAITCNYDNICVIASRAQRGAGALVVAALNSQNIEVKECTHVSAKELRKGSNIAHLSVLYGQDQKSGAITTRHAEGSIAKWHKILVATRASMHSGSLTKREVARVIGIMLYDQRLAGKKLHLQSQLINMLTELHPVRQWDEKWSGDTNTIQSILKRFETTLSNIPRVVHINPSPTKELIVASDACLKGAGHVIKWMDESPLEVRAYVSSITEDTHIFVHEMVAAYVAIKSAVGKIPPEDLSKVKVYFLIDNAAVAGAIAKGVTTVRAVQGVLGKICTILEKFNSHVVRNIPGKLNAADGPSRGVQPEHIDLMELFARDEVFIGGSGRNLKADAKIEPATWKTISEQLELMNTLEDVFELEVCLS